MIRVATTGSGYFSRFHYDGWNRMESTRVEALCARNRVKAEDWARQMGVPEVYTDVAQMLDEVKPDLFDIITPPETHLAMVREAAERGIDVVCQKPVAPTFEEAEEVVRVAEEAGIMLVIHENFRFMPWYRRMKQCLDEDMLGDLYAVTFRLRPGDGQGPEAYLERQPYFQQMERFLVHETAIHLIDTFRYLFGEVEAITSRLRKVNPVIAGEDAGYIIFEFANRATGLFDGNRLSDHQAQNHRLTMGEMVIEGQKGVLRLDGFGRIWFRGHFAQDESEVAYEFEDNGFGGDCVYLFQKHVVDHLEKGTPLENTGREYLTNLAIEEGVYTSSNEGRRVTFNKV